MNIMQPNHGFEPLTSDEQTLADNMKSALLREHPVCVTACSGRVAIGSGNQVIFLTPKSFKEILRAAENCGWMADGGGE